jgi:uncharacterized protein YbjT (DUF2867 family)
VAGLSFKVLVVGASGQIGRRVCRELLERDVAVRGLTHSETGARCLAELGVADIVRADLSDPPSLSRAFAAVDRVMLITRAIQNPRQELHAVDAARDAGVDRIVKLSSEILYYHWDTLRPGSRATPPDMVAALHGPAEDHIRATGIESVMLRPTWFMSLHANPLTAPGFANNQFVWPQASAGLALIHPEDVAAVAVECLVAQSPPESPVHLTGPKELSPGQIAAGFAEATGAPLVPVSPSLDDYEGWLETVAGMPRQASRIVAPYAERRNVPVSDAVERLLGRRAKNLAHYLDDEVRTATQYGRSLA